MLYKLMMSKTSVDTRATTYQFRSNMSYLENYMETIGSNIELFNLYVKNSREGLKCSNYSVVIEPLQTQI